MHRKEQVIAPLLLQLGLRTVVPALDTDQFGTFTRDIQRPADQLKTARIKAEAALQITGGDLAIASEGSFGSHPAIPWLPYNREIVLLIDRTHDLEIVGEAVSTETNFSHTQVSDLAAARAFADKVGFPDHGLVVSSGPEAPGLEIIKGITAATDLSKAVTQMLDCFGQAHLETDMRAMHNPTRMKVIAQAAKNLVAKMQSSCPQCKTPGFSVVEHLPGLPCAACGAPTRLTLTAIRRCRRCGSEQQELFPHQQQAADPGQCDYCNP
jgi:hypothetical protein